MSFDRFLQTAWSEHGDRPAEVAERLAQSADLVGSRAHVEPFAHLIAHVFGEHLGEFDRGVALLMALRSLDACAAEAEQRAVGRRIAALRYAAGDRDPLTDVADDETVSVLATAASMLSGRNDFPRALATYRDALHRCPQALDSGSPVARAMAVAGNNLAAALEAKAERSDDETRGMVLAAESGLKYWKIAGSWLEHERAEYRLARSLIEAGRPAEAARAATRCVEVCAANEASALELFFGHAARALAHGGSGDEEAFASARRAALDAYAQVDDDARHWCAEVLREISPPA